MRNNVLPSEPDKMLAQKQKTPIHLHARRKTDKGTYFRINSDLLVVCVLVCMHVLIAVVLVFSIPGDSFFC